jgi:hypothetical protein
MPDFYLAKGNLGLVDKMEGEKNGPGTPPANNGTTPPKKTSGK